MFDLQPHQERAVKKMHNGSVLYAEPGTGKTHTAIGYYLEKEAPRPIYVITTAKKRDSLDWEHTALEAGISHDPGSSLGSVITVDSWNNLPKYVGVEDAFFIFDEQRLVGSGAWSKAFLKIAPNNRWIMATGTPGDTWLDYVPLFIANGFVKNRTQFKERYVRYAPYSKFPKVIGYNHVGELVKWRNSILVHMPYQRHTSRVLETIRVAYDPVLLRRVVKERWHVYEDRPLKDVSELFSVMKRVVYSDSSRLDSVRKLLTKHPKLIVFYQYDYELEILRTLSGLTKSSSGVDQTNEASGQTINGYWTKDEGNGEMWVPMPSSDPWDYLLSPEGMSANESSGREQTSNLLVPGLKETGSTRSPENPTSPGTIQVHEPIQMTTTTQSTGDFTVAEWNGHKHEPIPRTDSWLYLVQYVAGSEAWNCIETDAMCFWSRTYSYKIWHQSHGRIDRLNTPFAKLYYYTLDAGTEIEKAVAGSLRAKKSFNEVDYVKSWQVVHADHG